MTNKKLLAGIGLVAGLAISGNAVARDQIHIVGSSTVFPFSTAVAEQFGKSTSFKTPLVESTGSGGGLKLFCAGIGTEHPDMTNASRRIKKSEVERCAKNGISKITEVKVGFDGIAFAHSKAAKATDYTLKQLYLALAKDVPMSDSDCTLKPNPYKMWSDIDSSLPAKKIEVLGPPPTSGTRDAWSELAMEGGAKKIACMAAMRKADKKKFKAVAHAVREDGAFVEAGENDNLIVQKLEANPDAYGIFGFSFLDQNLDKVRGAKINGVLPEFELIAAGDYPVSRSLFFYVKQAHVGTIPGMQEFVAEFTSERAFGDEGYLTDKGLIPLQEADRKKIRSNAANQVPLSM